MKKPEVKKAVKGKQAKPSPARGLFSKNMMAAVRAAKTASRGLTILYFAILVNYIIRSHENLIYSRIDTLFYFLQHPSPSLSARSRLRSWLWCPRPSAASKPRTKRSIRHLSKKVLFSHEFKKRARQFSKKMIYLTSRDDNTSVLITILSFSRNNPTWLNRLVWVS